MTANNNSAPLRLGEKFFLFYPVYGIIGKSL